MSLKIKEIKNKAMELSADERALLAQQLWDSIDNFMNPEIEHKWFETAKQRWQDIEEGKVECIPAEKVMRKARNILKKQK